MLESGIFISCTEFFHIEDLLVRLSRRNNFFLKDMKKEKNDIPSSLSRIANLIIFRQNRKYLQPFMSHP